MTYAEAMEAARNGQRVCAGYMSPGWSVAWLPWRGGGGFFFINPHTGSNFEFCPAARDLAATWSLLKAQLPPAKRRAKR